MYGVGEPASYPITGASYSVVVGGNSGLLGKAKITLQACGGTWSGGSCSGTTSTIGSWTSASSAPVAGPAPASSGGVLELNAAASGSGLLGGTITADISVSVSSAAGNRQIRTATTTNG